MLNGLTLRWRLVLAFLAVSVPPVLIASYVAAVLISSSFKHNVERWLGRAADFLVSETMSSEDEADRAASILGASLPTHGGALTGEVNENSTSLRVYSDLLSTVGYDLVLIYDDKGNTLYRFGNATLDMPLPRTSTRSVFTVTREDRPGLVVGAARMFERDGQVLHVLVANQIDDSFFAAPRAKTAIIIHAYRLQGNNMIPLVREGRGDPRTISDDVLAILNRGDSYTVVPDNGSGGLATGYGAIRDDSGRLVGIVTFGLAARRPVFEQLIDWRLFTILALIASSLSITVGIVLASRLTGPLQSLKRGLREVASGNYRLQLPERGGPEIAEVASGFNIMTRQLERCARWKARCAGANSWQHSARQPPSSRTKSATRSASSRRRASWWRSAAISPSPTSGCSGSSSTRSTASTGWSPRCSTMYGRTGRPCGWSPWTRSSARRSTSWHPSSTSAASPAMSR
nr:HAMP domain-containing protein [Mesorhizobium amorphae]